MKLNVASIEILETRFLKETGFLAGEEISETNTLLGSTKVRTSYERII